MPFTNNMRDNCTRALQMSWEAKEVAATYAWAAVALGCIALYAADKYVGFKPLDIESKFDGEGKLIPFDIASKFDGEGKLIEH